MKHVVWIFVVLLLVLHHDFWYWNDATLVFGIFPMGLFYHMCLSVAATLLWLFCVTFAWPNDLSEAAADDDAAGVEDLYPSPKAKSGGNQ